MFKIVGFKHYLDCWMRPIPVLEFARQSGAEFAYPAGYTMVKDYVRQSRISRQEMFELLSHAPGEAQADFGEAVVVITGAEQTAHFMVFDLPHSDDCFVQAFPTERTEAFLAGHVVENLVGYARRNFIVPIPRASSWEELDTQLEADCRGRCERRLRGCAETIGERFQRAYATMLPLPNVPFEPCEKVTVRVSSLALVRYRSRYRHVGIKGLETRFPDRSSVAGAGPASRPRGARPFRSQEP